MLLGAWLSNSDYGSNQRTMALLYEYKIEEGGGGGGQSKVRSLTAENVYLSLFNLVTVSNNYFCTVAKNDLAKGNGNGLFLLKRLISIEW